MASPMASTVTWTSPKEMWKTIQRVTVSEFIVLHLPETQTADHRGGHGCHQCLLPQGAHHAQGADVTELLCRTNLHYLGGHCPHVQRNRQNPVGTRSVQDPQRTQLRRGRSDRGPLLHESEAGELCAQEKTGMHWVQDDLELLHESEAGDSKCALRAGEDRHALGAG